MYSLRLLIRMLSRQFSFSEDQDHEEEISASIRRGVEFQGLNAWVLVFAIFIASIGLNVNSTAVVIGAMLISPLMGPIMGIGLAVGIYDFELLKRSFINLLFMVIVSLATSVLYFAISPISVPSNELLARTTPTIWDVAIAFIGGLAGIIVGSSRQKGNAIPGVAIATALMPPLCTAGYGLASGQLEFFFGAFYLFFINAVMIGLATSLTVRFLNFTPVAQPNPVQQKRVKRWVSLVVLLTILPSIWLGYRIVDKNLFESRVKQFIDKELNFPNSQPILRNVQIYPEKVATILLIGEPVSDDTLNYHLARKALYRLENATMSLRQANGDALQNTFKDSILSQRALSGSLLRNKEMQIQQLEKELDSLRRQTPQTGTTLDVLAELKAFDHRIQGLSLGQAPWTQGNGKEKLTWIANVDLQKNLEDPTRFQLEKYLRQRLKIADLRIVWTSSPTSVSPKRKPHP